jgi:hypothetical protein
MVQPVLAADGFSCEKEAIETWFATGSHTSPKTGEICWRMLTYAEVCWRILLDARHSVTYADVCWRGAFFFSPPPYLYLSLESLAGLLGQCPALTQLHLILSLSTPAHTPPVSEVLNRALLLFCLFFSRYLFIFASITWIHECQCISAIRLVLECTSHYCINILMLQDYGWETQSCSRILPFAAWSRKLLPKRCTEVIVLVRESERESERAAQSQVV